MTRWRSAGCGTSASSLRAERGLTLVELLVVLGIISVLLAALLPAVGRVRESARRTLDLSNLHQLTVATLAYAHACDGVFPPGRSEYAPPGGDDYTWVSYDHCWKPLQALVPALRSLAACQSVREGYADAEDFGNPLPSYGSGSDVRVGWIYWGGRDDLSSGGTLQYRSLRSAGDRATPGSQTLWTCWCWDSAGFGGPSVCPHVGGRYVEYPSGVPLKPPPDGLGVALADGSASFVPWDELGIVPQSNGFKLYYQP